MKPESSLWSKQTIVEKYFGAWSQIITGYVDLFAGPGRYKDGAISTPLRVLNTALQNEQIHDRLITIFNDKDENHARTLSEAIGDLEQIKLLKHAPQIWNEEVGVNIALQFEKMSVIPVLAFIDPWGYKGLSLRLVNAFLKDWGCDCLFFAYATKLLENGSRMIHAPISQNKVTRSG